MGNLMLSLLGTLSPGAYNLFLLVVLVFLAGGIAWKEQKKRQGKEQNVPKAPQKEKKAAPPLSRAAALGVMVACIPLLVVGLVMLIGAAALSKPLFIALGALLSVVGLMRMERAGKDLRSAPRGQVPSPPPPQAPVDPKRLEQLKSLRKAGLLTDQEYEEKRTELLEERK